MNALTAALYGGNQPEGRVIKFCPSHGAMNFMKTSRKSPARKLGANRGEIARKQHTHDPNFSQSKDLHEDRGMRQIKTGVMGQRFGR